MTAHPAAHQTERSRALEGQLPHQWASVRRREGGARASRLRWRPMRPRYLRRRSARR